MGQGWLSHTQTQVPRREPKLSAPPPTPHSTPGEQGGTHHLSRHCHQARFPDQQSAHPGKLSAHRLRQHRLCSPSAGSGSAACSPLLNTKGNKDGRKQMYPRFSKLQAPTSLTLASLATFFCIFESVLWHVKKNGKEYVCHHCCRRLVGKAIFFLF